MTLGGAPLSTQKAGMKLVSSEIASTCTSTLFKSINMWEEAVDDGEMKLSIAESCGVIL